MLFEAAFTEGIKVLYSDVNYTFSVRNCGMLMVKVTVL